jgi:hypothetical protein
MQNQTISLQEKMVLFWHNHFVSGYASVNDARYMYLQNVLFRTNAFGNFKDLTRSVTCRSQDARISGSPNDETFMSGQIGDEMYASATIHRPIVGYASPNQR